MPRTPQPQPTRQILRRLPALVAKSRSAAREPSRGTFLCGSVGPSRGDPFVDADVPSAGGRERLTGLNRCRIRWSDGVLSTTEMIGHPDRRSTHRNTDIS